VPEGTVIGPHGYIIFAASKPLFLLSYPGYDPDQVIHLDWRRSDTLSNGSDTVSLVHPNQVGTNGQPSIPTDIFTYSGQAAGSGAGNTGFTLELIDMHGPNEDMASWGVSLTEAGSPGRRNTLDN